MLRLLYTLTIFTKLDIILIRYAFSSVLFPIKSTFNSNNKLYSSSLSIIIWNNADKLPPNCFSLSPDSAKLTDLSCIASDTYGNSSVASIFL